MNKELNNVFSNEYTAQLVMTCANYWLGVTMSYLKNTKTEFDPALVIEINNVLEAVEGKESADVIWEAFFDLVSVARRKGMDLAELPTHCFGRSYR